MRFFGAPGVLLALGVSAVAGHSYHAFEHDYQPVVSYGGLPKHEDFTHDDHIANAFGDLSAVPEIHEDFHVNQGFVNYLEPHIDHIHHEDIDDHSQHEFHDFGHHDLQAQHENYVLHDNNDHSVKDTHNNHHHHHEHHETYVLHDSHEGHEQDDKQDHMEEHEHHGNNDHHEKHEDHDDSHKHKSEANYEFKYGVNDPKTGDVKQQWESRTGDKVKGGYSLKEADGTTRVVHYSADKKKGFQATVHKIGHPNEKHSEHGHHEH